MNCVHCPSSDVQEPLTPPDMGGFKSGVSYIIKQELRQTQQAVLSFFVR
jgi:hypothetical protein